MPKIGKMLVSVDVNGPGRRFVIWFQECPFRCHGCFNPEFWGKSGGDLMDVGEIIRSVDLSHGIEGVTFSGGEPFLQAKEILPLAEQIRHRGLTIVSYSGYRLDELLSGEIPYAKELLQKLDILIDGLYEEEEKAPLLWRGSRNQKVHFLTPRYQQMEQLTLEEGTASAELRIGENEMSITGIFDPQVWYRLKKALQKG